MSDTSPTRAAWITPDGRLGLACACGSTILVFVEPVTDRRLITEFAVTCDVCGSAHWITPVMSGEEPWT